MSEPTLLLAPLRPRSTEPHLWKGGRIIADAWRLIAGGEPLANGVCAIVTLSRWRAEQAALVVLGVPLGVWVGANETIDPATDDLDRLEVVALEFPRFTDGRAYSTARRLREQHGYRGELRATGDVLLDQLPLMMRCGFDAFEIVDAPTIAALERGELPAVSRTYQSTAGPLPVDRRSRRPPARQARTAE